MKNRFKGKTKYIYTSITMLMLLAVTIATTGKQFFQKDFYTILTTTDSIPAKKTTSSATKKIQPSITSDSISKNTLVKNEKKDTIIISPKIDTLNYKVSKDSLNGPVSYHADDSMVMDVPSKKITLYGKQSTAKYLENDLSAPVISFDQQSNLISAYYSKDSNGNVIAQPTFRQGELITVSDSIRFNMKSGKGLTKGTYTQQGEMYIYGEKIKKIDSSVFFAYNARFTTCNLDTPHFSFVSKKIKFKTNKFAITGPVHPEFEGVPIPIILPFGIFPMSQGRHSGFIAPAFTTNQQFGLALEGIGYYKVINDIWDVTARGTVYSYGGWSASLVPRYYKRYRYQGGFQLDYQKTKINFKGDPDYTSTNTFNIRWNHTADTKSRPGVNFNASVNAGSTKFNQFVPNNPVRNFNNQLSSTISYTKVWKDKPFNLALIANHSQNTNQKTINITLPDVSFNVNTIYPFRKKESIGLPKWYENIGIALNSNVKTQTVFSDDTTIDKRPIGKQILNNYQWGSTHNVPISLSLPPIGPFQISPSITYSERWHQQKLVKSWNGIDRKLDTTINKGFFTTRDMAFSLGVSTRIFGMFGFGKNAKVQAIRHELRPQISANYVPNINGKFYYNTQIDTFGNIGRYSVFQGNIVSPYGEGTFGGLSFGIDNILQMKVRNTKDTTEGATKKVSLLDGLGITSGYNFLSDSFQLQAFSINARTNLFDKFNITASAFVDPYLSDTFGRRINKLVWKERTFTLGSLNSASISISSQFQGGDKSKKKKVPNQLQRNINPSTGLPLSDDQSEAAYIRTNPGEYADFSIPWSINFGYSLRYSKAFNSIERKFKGTFNSDINLSGTINLTPKWQIGLTGVYNFTTQSIGVVSMSISREMHCWQMAINISPVGSFKFFTITISPKSALLRDLRINRTRNFYDL